MSTNRVVVVTGGASGIGLGVVQLFVELGHPVAMLDMNPDTLAAESAALTAAGGKVLALKVDVSDRAAVDAAYDQIRTDLGPIAIVIANAGISIPQAFATMTVAQWQQTIDVNLTGVFHTVQAALPDMLEAGWGRVVTISSQAAQSGAQDRAHYAASKGGVIGLTRSLARELGATGITVNTVPPSLVDTPMARKAVEVGQVPSLEVIAQHIPVPRPGTPSDIAAACAYFASDAASYVTGQSLGVNGGSWMT